MLACDREQVHIDARTPDDLLRLGHAPDRDDAVAQTAGGLVVEVLRRFGHVALQASEQRFLAAFQEQHDLVDQRVVVVFRLVAHARREAAFDVILQARPLAFAVDRLAASAQRKHYAHEIDQFAQPVGVGVRTEVARTVVLDRAREHDARETARSSP